MLCILPFLLSINDKTYGNIKPSRGLRQGDPLSPYLFLLCVKGFTSLLARAEMEEKLHGVSICRRTPKVSHLLFADDSLLFCQASRGEVQAIKDIIYFSSNTGEDQKEWIKDCLGVREVDKFETYLGLSTLLGRSKYQAFSFLKDRV